jgi:hypothetical protein
MKNLLRALMTGLFALALVCSASAPLHAQTGGPSRLPFVTGIPPQYDWAFTFTTSSGQTPSFNTAGVAWYQVFWITQGTISGCTLTIDGLVAGGTYSTGSLMSSQSCTSNNSYTSGSAVYATSAKVTPTITGSGSVSVYIFGYINNPASSGGSSVVSLTVPTNVFSGQSAVTGTAAALTGQALTKGVCVEALSTNTISVYIGPSGVTTSTGIEVPAGSGFCIAVSNTNILYVVASTTGATVTWAGN